MADKLQSEKVVVQAPMSFTGSAKRLWKITGNNPVQKALLAIPAIVLIVLAWMLILVWYLVFGLLLVPYRLLRRGSRKRKKQEKQHREVLEKIETTAREAQEDA